MSNQTLTERRQHPTQEPPWDTADGSRRRAHPLLPVIAVVAAAILGIVALGSSALRQQPDTTNPAASRGAADASPDRDLANSVGTRAPEACHAPCEFSSAGSADLHAFGHEEGSVLHVLFLEARWTNPKLRRLRRRAEAWRQTVTLHARKVRDRSPVVLDHWASDLPGARVEAITADPGDVTFNVTVSRPDKLRAGRLYRTQVLVRSPQSLDGSVWHYAEHIDHNLRRARDRRFHADESSTPRRGLSGWCSECYVVWRVGAAEAR